MIPAPIPSDEGRRLDSLRSLGVLDTKAEERFDRIVRLAARLLNVPIALVSLVDDKRQWFKARIGLDAAETPRDISFCGHAIHEDSLFEISDASADERFRDNPLVAGNPHIRFYAGRPLKAPDGKRVGTLCVIDRAPRTLSAEDRQVLEDLARMAEDELALVPRSKPLPDTMPSAPDEQARYRLPRLGQIALLTAAFWITGKLALLLAIPPGYATAVWPPAGIALGLLLRWGPGVWPGVFLGSFLANFDPSHATLSLHALAPMAGIAIGSTLQALLAERLTRPVLRSSQPLSDIREVSLFLLLGGPVACVVNALCGPLILLLVGNLRSEAFAFQAFTWWIGDSIGVLVFAPLTYLVSADRNQVSRRRIATVGGPLLLSFGVIVAIFIGASRWEQRKMEADFIRRCDAIANSIRDQFATHVENLHAVHGLFISSNEVDRAEFAQFVRPILARHAGIQAIEWAPLVAGSDRIEIEAAARREGLGAFAFRTRLPDGTLVPSPVADEHMPIMFIEPVKGNEAALGLDLGSLSDRRQLIDVARRTRNAITSGRVSLVQASGDHAGILIMIPFFREDRFMGVVAGVFRMDRMIAAGLEGMPVDDIALRIEDTTESAGARLLYANEELISTHGNASSFSQVMGLDMPNRRWDLHFSLGASYLEAHKSLQAWSILAGGLLFTALLGSVFLVTTGRSALIEDLVVQRTSDLARAEAHARMAAERAEEANRAKGRFVSIISHELRTPLTSIHGSLRLLSEGVVGALGEDARELVEIAEKDTQRLARLINNVLDYQKIEAGRYEIARTRLDLAEVAAGALRSLEQTAASRGIALRRALHPAFVMGDPDAVVQVVTNLVSNALKFAPEKSDVTVTVECLPGEPFALFSVRDRGRGIPEEFRARIFGSFEQATGQGGRAKGGTGLGLAISKALVGMMGGRIWFETETGEGTVFSFTLPIAP